MYEDHYRNFYDFEWVLFYSTLFCLLVGIIVHFTADRKKVHKMNDDTLDGAGMYLLGGLVFGFVGLMLIYDRTLHHPTTPHLREFMWFYIVACIVGFYGFCFTIWHFCRFYYQKRAVRLWTERTIESLRTMPREELQQGTCAAALLLSLKKLLQIYLSGFGNKASKNELIRLSVQLKRMVKDFDSKQPIEPGRLREFMLDLEELEKQVLRS